jgi:hypothetical protein
MPAMARPAGFTRRPTPISAMTPGFLCQGRRRGPRSPSRGRFAARAACWWRQPVAVSAGRLPGR